MSISNRKLPITVLLAVLMAVSACGQKGELYLPDRPQQKISLRSDIPAN